MLDGVELYEADQGIQFHGRADQGAELRIIGKLGFSDHPMLEHFRFLKAHARGLPKMTIPSPTVLHFRLQRMASATNVYPDIDALLRTISAETYARRCSAFYDAGCRYLQFDDTVWAYLCSQEELRKARERGDECRRGCRSDLCRADQHGARRQARRT